MTPGSPQCLAIILCEGVVEDVRSRNKCILNTFNCVWARTFPVAHDRMTVFVSLTDGRGESPIQVRFMQDAASDQRILFELGGAIRFPSPLDVVDVTFDLRNVPVPEAGNYAIQILVGGTLVGERRLVAKVIPREEKRS
jgi:hypothetical protein